MAKRQPQVDIMGPAEGCIEIPIPEYVLTQCEANMMDEELKYKMEYNGMGTDFTCFTGKKSNSKAT